MWLLWRPGQITAVYRACPRLVRIVCCRRLFPRTLHPHSIFTQPGRVLLSNSNTAFCFVLVEIDLTHWQRGLSKPLFHWNRFPLHHWVLHGRPQLPRVVGAGCRPCLWSMVQEGPAAGIKTSPAVVWTSWWWGHSGSQWARCQHQHIILIIISASRIRSSQNCSYWCVQQCSACPVRWSFLVHI